MRQPTLENCDREGNNTPVPPLDLIAATLLDSPLNEPGSNRGTAFVNLSVVGDSRAASGAHFSSPSVDRTDRAGALNGRCEHRRWRVDAGSCGHRSIWRPSDVAGNDRHSDAGVLQPGHHALRALYRGIDFCGLLSHSPGTLVLDRFLSLHRRRGLLAVSGSQRSGGFVRGVAASAPHGPGRRFGEEVLAM